MTSSNVGPIRTNAGGGESARLVLGIAIPLAITAVAFGLGWINDQLDSIGPLDQGSLAG